MSLSSGRRRRRGRCPSTVRSLCFTHVLNPLGLTLCLVVAVIYSLTDKLRNFVAGIFIPQYHFTYAVALCFGQVLVSLLAINLLHVLDLVPLKRYSRVLGERMLVPAVCNSAHAVLTMWAKANSSCSGLFPLTATLQPLLTVGWSFVLRVPSPPSSHISLLISIFSVASVIITASRGLSGIEPLEYVYAPLALIVQSLSLIWLSKVLEAEGRCSPDPQTSVCDIYYTQLVNQSWVLGLLFLLHPDSPWKVIHQSSWHSLLFHGYLLAILLLGMVLDCLVCLSVLCLSPLAAALIHSAGALTQTFTQLL
ncbi:uncharacterized protein LOC117523858 [Thalassophryne amazonica]|uniref:uncharacterized protein LOC117523858 n=1 Tax=Thalassophryne amazonica TaxID=390379 RepID=UPI001471BA15|nr:uncharacterized protein LOC117523858 [Thalassophryne amazonica]